MPQAVTSAIQEGIHEAEEYTAEMLEEAKKDLATKEDLMRLEMRLESRIAKMESRLNKNLAELLQKLLERDVNSSRFTVGALIALTAILPRLTCPQILC